MDGSGKVVEIGRKSVYCGGRWMGQTKTEISPRTPLFKLHVESSFVVSLIIKVW